MNALFSHKPSEQAHGIGVSHFSASAFFKLHLHHVVLRFNVLHDHKQPVSGSSDNFDKIQAVKRVPTTLGEQSANNFVAVKKGYRRFNVFGSEKEVNVEENNWQYSFVKRGVSKSKP